MHILYMCVCFQREKKASPDGKKFLPRFQVQGLELTSSDKVKGTTWSDTQREIFPNPYTFISQ